MYPQADRLGHWKKNFLFARTTRFVRSATSTEIDETFNSHWRQKKTDNIVVKKLAEVRAFYIKTLGKSDSRQLMTQEYRMLPCMRSFLLFQHLSEISISWYNEIGPLDNLIMSVFRLPYPRAKGGVMWWVNWNTAWVLRRENCLVAGLLRVPIMVVCWWTSSVPRYAQESSR